MKGVAVKKIAYASYVGRGGSPKVFMGTQGEMRKGPQRPALRFLAYFMKDPSR